MEALGDPRETVTSPAVTERNRDRNDEQTRGEAIVGAGELADLELRRADLGRQLFQPV